MGSADCFLLCELVWTNVCFGEGKNVTWLPSAPTGSQRLGVAVSKSKPHSLACTMVSLTFGWPWCSSLTLPSATTSGSSGSSVSSSRLRRTLDLSAKAMAGTVI